MKAFKIVVLTLFSMANFACMDMPDLDSLLEAPIAEETVIEEAVTEETPTTEEVSQAGPAPSAQDVAAWAGGGDENEGVHCEEAVVGEALAESDESEETVADPELADPETTAEPAEAATTECTCLGTNPVATSGSLAPPQLVINELYYDHPGSDTDGVLFAELYGPTGLDLSGYQILFVNGDDGAITKVIQLPEGAAIQGNGFYVVADGRTGALDTTQVANADFIDNFDPQNGPDGVQLIDAEGSLMDTLAYGEGVVATAENGLALGEGSPAPDVAGGQSLAREPAGADTDNNAADFVVNTVPSPGEASVVLH